MNPKVKYVSWIVLAVALAIIIVGSQIGDGRLVMLAVPLSFGFPILIAAAMAAQRRSKAMTVAAICLTACCGWCCFDLLDGVFFADVQAGTALIEDRGDETGRFYLEPGRHAVSPISTLKVVRIGEGRAVLAVPVSVKDNETAVVTFAAEWDCGPDAVSYFVSESPDGIKKPVSPQWFLERAAEETLSNLAKQNAKIDRATVEPALEAHAREVLEHAHIKLKAIGVALVSVRSPK